MRKLTDKVTFRHGATITTRTAQSPMLTNSGVDEFVSDDTLNYYAARSQSAGMVIVEYTNVSLSGGHSRSWPDHTQIAVYDDKFIPGLTKIATALKKDGNKAILNCITDFSTSKINLTDALTYLTEFPGLFFDRPVFAALKYLHPAVRILLRRFINIA